MSRIQQNIYKTSSISSSFLRDDSIHRTDTKLSKTPEKNAAKETVVKIHAMYTLVWVWYVFHSALNMDKIVHSTQFYNKKHFLKFFSFTLQVEKLFKIKSYIETSLNGTFFGFFKAKRCNCTKAEDI